MTIWLPGSDVAVIVPKTSLSRRPRPFAVAFATSRDSASRATEGARLSAMLTSVTWAPAFFFGSGLIIIDAVAR